MMDADWTIVFAFFPVRTLTGESVWLRNVLRRWNNDLNPWCDAHGHSGADGGYEYRSLETTHGGTAK